MNHTNTQSQATIRGFTIIEILVTVGVLILVAVGVSTIFSSIAETVNNGKRVAEINRFSAQLERVMRRDFENITRDGFMVIVHQYAPGDEPVNGWNDRDVQLSPADATDENANGDPGRPRRVDEIMFFSRGQYETARRAIAPSMIARSSEAAIYYGHGQKRRPKLTGNLDNANNLFFNPAIEDFNPASDKNNNYFGVNLAGLGVIATDGILNPNRYAADWSLLRHVTLLAQPETSGQDLPDELFGVRRVGDERQWLEDSDRQVALQPALRTIFGSLNLTLATTPSLPKWFKEYRPGGGAVLLQDAEAYRASGLVDVVTDDLPSIATIVRNGPGSGGWLGSPIDPIYTDFDIFNAQLETDVPTEPVIDPQQAINPASSIAQQRLWMLDALPSRWDLNTLTQLSRVRYEDIPTRILFEETAFGGPNSDASKRLRTYAEADQEMLGSSVFVPRCTEFIVEWSMGFIDRTITNPLDPEYKRMLWYGLPRAMDENDDGNFDPSRELYADRYLPRDLNSLPNGEEKNKQIATEKWMSELVMGHNAALQRDTEISMFGYQYSNPDGAFASDPVQPWPWPKFIRITISIADANDITLERTFQMVFEIPDASNN